MKQQLFLRLLADECGVLWLINDHDSGVRQGHADSLQVLVEQKPELKQLPAVVLVPGEKVLTLDVEVPARWSQETINWAVEEQISGSPDEVFVCPLDSRNDQGFLPVAVVDRQLLSLWRNQLRSAGLKVSAFLPDYLAQPFQLEQIPALEDSGRVLIRTGQYQGVSLPESWLEQWQTLQAQTHGAIKLNFAEKKDTVSPLEHFATQWQDNGVNLLQGEFRLKSSRAGLRRFAPALAMLAAALVIQTSLFTWDSIQLMQEKKRLDTEISQLFKQTMGSHARQVKPVHQLKSRLAEFGSTSQSSALSSLNLLVQVWPEQGAHLSEIVSEQDQLQLTVEVDKDSWPEFRQSLSAYTPVNIKQASRSEDTGVQRILLEVGQ